MPEKNTKKRGKKKPSRATKPVPKRPTRTQPNPPRPPKGKDPKTLPLKGTQKQGDGRHNSQGISVEKYNEMAEAFWEVQSANHVARTCKVTNATAKKYIEKGDPRRNLPPIRDRWNARVEEVIEEQDETWTDTMRHWAKILKKGRSILEERLGQIVPEDISPEKLFELMGKMLKDESFVKGGPDSRYELSADPLDKLSIPELIDYIEKGNLPGQDMPGMTKAATGDDVKPDTGKGFTE